MAVKKKSAGPKKSSPRKQKGSPKQTKSVVFRELKKILVGMAILISICLTGAMVADLLFHPGRRVPQPARKTDPQVVEKPDTGRKQEPKAKTPAKPPVPEKIRPIQEDITVAKAEKQKDPTEKKQVAGLAGKSEKSIQYEVFEDIDSAIIDTPRPSLKDRVPRIAVIIDDIGYDQQIAMDLRDLNPDITFSVLPYSPFGREISEKLHSKGAEIMLHLPMEPVDYPEVDPGPGAILSTMAPDSLLAQLRENIRSVPHIVGVNNHMGSELTTHADRMNQIFTILKKENLFFVDSRTASKSQAYSSARLLKIRFAHRDVFLDNIQNPEYISGQFRELVRLAEKQGSAIGIGHPYKATLQSLSKELPKLNNKVAVVRVSELTMIPD